MKRLLIIEPNLRTPSGHYAEFVRALGTRTEETPIDVFAHPDADGLLDLIPGAAPYRAEPRVGSPLAEWRMITQAVAGDNPFLVLTSDGRHAAAVSLAATLTGRKPHHARFYFHWIPEGFQQSVLHRISSAAREHALAVVPTEAIAQALREAGWRRVAYVPYPAFGPDEPPVPAPFSHVLVAGAARANKGLDLVVGLAQQWSREDRSIPLLVQASTKHALRHGRREVKLVEALLASGYGALEADGRAPERPEYIARFHGALVLAPYERERFAHAVSGVVLDALLHGAPVIATRGTWPGAQVDRFGAGVTIQNRTPESLSAAIDTVLADWPAYSVRACQAARTLAKEHDPQNLLVQLR